MSKVTDHVHGARSSEIYDCQSDLTDLYNGALLGNAFLKSHQNFLSTRKHQKFLKILQGDSSAVVEIFRHPDGEMRPIRP